MTPLHVAIAVLHGTTGGPATYGRMLVAALAARGDLRLSVITDRPAAFAPAGIELCELPMRGGLDRLRWQYRAVPKLLQKLGATVYHDTKNALPFRLQKPAVVTVHDLAYHTVPGSFGLASRLFLRWATRDAVARAAAVIVPSQATATDLLRIHPRSAGRVHVVPHGIEPARPCPAAELATVRARLQLPSHYVLHLGTVQARKNVDLVVDAVRLLRRRGLPHRAVVIGRRGWLADAAIASIRADDTALWIEHVDQADLPAVYAGAAAFVSPSAYEGFGFAVADALAAGVPTVISSISSLPELCGDAALQLPRLDATAIADALARVFGEPALAATLRLRGPERAAGFSWRAAAEGHVQAYRRAAGS